MAKEKTPITLLCGYLGAGKTTLLNQVLSNQKGYKVAVIVNDIGEVNVDAKLIAEGAKITDTSDIVPLTNGCICCTLKSDLSKNIENLIKSKKYDYVMIEASGVCEPMPIAQEIETIKNGVLDNVVGVVDAARLVDEFAGGNKLLNKEKIGEEDIESLLVQQIEFCSTLVINKKDLVTEDEFKKVRKVIETLHPEVKIIETDHGKVDVAEILSTGSFDFEKVYASAGWCKKLEEGDFDEDDEDEHEHGEHDHHDDEHGHHHEHEGEHHHEHDGYESEHDEHHHHEHEDEHGHHHAHHHHEHKHEGDSGADEDEYGIGTFIYYRRKPFVRQLLDEFASRWPKNIIRCKGLMWFEDEPEMAWVFETSGRQIQAGYSGQWIAVAPEKEQKEILEANPDIKKEWDSEVGDRMIKLCIIGQDLDKKAITAELDKCLAK
ncbi:CobW family GTP-binding protein [Treponema pectinovorum]|uniref:CobW family GTP-binding protein n=1 Tax=Treponema pectinovorum TaxID=164 RepID=UPI0011CA4675|nr:GTP-binding protein [Treponema pectinovorum]